MFFIGLPGARKPTVRLQLSNPPYSCAVWHHRSPTEIGNVASLSAEFSGECFQQQIPSRIGEKVGAKLSFADPSSGKNIANVILIDGRNVFF